MIKFWGRPVRGGISGDHQTVESSCGWRYRMPLAAEGMASGDRPDDPAAFAGAGDHAAA